MNKEIVIIPRGGLGDVIVSTPLLAQLKQTYPESKLIVYYTMRSHGAILENNPDIDFCCYYRLRSMWRKPRHFFWMIFNRERINANLLSFQHIPPTFIYSKSIKEIIADIFDLKLNNTNVRLFFTEKEDKAAISRLSAYKNVVLMHIHSRSAPNHHWRMENWNSLVKQLPGYTFIQLGHDDEPLVEGVVDWRDKTTVREMLCLLKHSTSFIGVDSSLSHATNAFDLPGVVLFGDSSPVFWGHDNNINIYKKVACSPCYYYLYAAKCPYNHECMEAITIDEVREALIKQVTKSNERIKSGSKINN